MAYPPPSHSSSVDPIISLGAPGGPGMGGPVGGYPHTEAPRDILVHVLDRVSTLDHVCGCMRV